MTVYSFAVHTDEKKKGVDKHMYEYLRQTDILFLLQDLVVASLSKIINSGEYKFPNYS